MPEGGGRTTMALVYVHCPECQSIDVVQYGKQANGTQRYRCNNRDCPRTIFLLQYADKGRLPAVKQQIVDMTLNGSGVRDIVRVLGVSSATVIDVLKKKGARSQGSNPWQTQGMALDVPLLAHFPLDPIASLRYKMSGSLTLWFAGWRRHGITV